MRVLKFECNISDITPLKVPRVYRVKGICSDVELEIEFHEDIIEGPRKGSKMIVEVTTTKEECLKHYFCAHGYVVSNTQLGSIHRVVISLHGFLVVIRSGQAINLNTADHVYLGVTLAS